ncbi:MAG: DUF6687 family protein [Acidimicrobiales bacterium]
MTRGLAWLPACALKGRPHILVDSGAVAGTVLSLSHWPASPTPAGLRRDTSAEIAIAYLGEALRDGSGPAAWPAPLVATDHLDQDGLAAAWALTQPEGALDRAPKLVALAEAGDFAVVSDRDAARASFALATLADPGRSPLGAQTWQADPCRRQSALGAELLARVGELLDDPVSSRHLWAEEDESLERGLAEIGSGRVVVEEVPDLDLAVVRVPQGPRLLATRFLDPVPSSCHPAAIHARTAASRLLVDDGGSFRLVLRYEGWVRTVRRRPKPRVDLSGLAEQLSAAEPGGTGWTFSGVSALVPVLEPEGGVHSELAFAGVRAATEHWLAAAPPAWGPEGPLPPPPAAHRSPGRR